MRETAYFVDARSGHRLAQLLPLNVPILWHPFLKGVERNMKVEGNASNFNLSGTAKGASVIKFGKIVRLMK